jgi:hypothetical protein
LRRHQKAVKAGSVVHFVTAVYIRTRSRIKWWDTDATTFRLTTLGMQGREHEVPDDPITHSYWYTDDVPVFFGHYWLKGKPYLTGDTRACLDFSVARSGFLAAYRWSGERFLKCTSWYLIGHLAS